jgi:ribosomal protein L29
MKKSLRNELRAKDPQVLAHQISELRAKYAKLKFDIASGKTAARKEAQAIRREIATMLTILGEQKTS